MTHEAENTQAPEVLIPASQPFYFDPKRMVFVIGEETDQRILDLDSVTDITDFSRKFTSEEDAVSYFSREIDPNTSETLLLHDSFGVGTLIQTKAARDKLREVARDSEKMTEMQTKVLNVMRTVYQRFSDDISDIDLFENDVDGFLSFACVIFKDGKFRLQTFGSCAGLDPNPDPTAVDTMMQEDDGSFPVELVPHNADTAAQRLSLFAGAGTIGWLTR